MEAVAAAESTRAGGLTHAVAVNVRVLFAPEAVAAASAMIACIKCACCAAAGALTRLEKTTCTGMSTTVPVAWST